MINWFLGLFKSKKQNLVDKYNRLLSESHKLSTSNRTLSDVKAAQANQVLVELDELLQEEDKDKYIDDPEERKRIHGDKAEGLL